MGELTLRAPSREPLVWLRLPEGDTLTLTELVDTDISLAGRSLQANVDIAVDPYEAPPEFIRQEFDPDIVNGGTELSASIQRLGNSLWATHAILGSGSGSNPDGGVTETSAIRWYEIDLDTKTVKQSGTIEHPFYNYIYPSIAVTEAGHVAISYTAAGVGENAGEGIFPSLAVSVGYNNGGNIIMEESQESSKMVKAGISTGEVTVGVTTPAPLLTRMILQRHGYLDTGLTIRFAATDKSRQLKFH